VLTGLLTLDPEGGEKGTGYFAGLPEDIVKLEKQFCCGF